MEFPGIDFAFDVTREAITAQLGDDVRSLELEARLVASLVVLIVAEYEDFLEDCFCRRASQCGDPHVGNFMAAKVRQTFRSPDLGKISSTLGLLGEDLRKSFMGAIENTAAHAAWDNIMRARHAAVHKQGSTQLTFRELQGSYAKSQAVVAKVVEVLQV